MNYIKAEKALPKNTGVIKLYSPDDYACMAKVGKLVATCLDEINELIKPNIRTIDIDKFVYDFAITNNAMPATLNYRGYQHSCCISINHVVCHGIPSERLLKSGDILNIDITFILDGWHGDSSRMYIVGQAKPAAKRLVEITHECLMKGIQQVKPGNKIGDIGCAIQKHAFENRCSVVHDFCGHGIGKVFHDAPNILHYETKEETQTMVEGMIFTIEPMINLGKKECKVLDDGWTAVTKDKCLSAQFEHTIGVTKDGCQIFTLSPKDVFKEK